MEGSERKSIVDINDDNTEMVLDVYSLILLIIGVFMGVIQPEVSVS